MKKVRVGIVGLGRLGKGHAKNLAQHVSGCKLVAACSVVVTELDFANNELGVTQLYSDYEKMCQSHDIDAIFIVSPSGYHCDHIKIALENGKHVFCEKPLGLTIPEIQEVVELVAKYPQQIFMLGFMRRYDKSYQYAKALVEAGELGEITLMRCYGIDPTLELSGFVKFAGASQSGGIFADMSIHDIDLIRWFTKEEVCKVWAIGKNAAYPELDELGELETGAAMMQLTNRTIGLLVAGRNCQHGYHVETEIIGTKGMLRVGATPDKNLVTVFNPKGVIKPCSQNFPERFADAYLAEAQAFIHCIIEGKQPEVTAYDGLEATKIALLCKESYESNELLVMANDGK